MIALIVITIIIGLMFSTYVWERIQQRAIAQTSNDLLQDNILSYHLDWRVLESDHFQLIHFVKKVNATRRYAELTGVSREQAWQAVQDLTTNQKRKLRRIDDVLANEQDAVRRLILAGELDSAAQRLAESMDIDIFTAQEALTYIQHELEQKETK